MGKQTIETGTLLFDGISKIWNDNTDIEIIGHSRLNQKPKEKKVVIGTVVVKAYGNVIPISDA